MKANIINLGAVSIPDTLLLFAVVIAGHDGNRLTRMDAEQPSNISNLHNGCAQILGACKTWRRLLWEKDFLI